MVNKDMQVYLFRHGEAYVNKRPEYIAGRSTSSPLTDNGVVQARKLGCFLRSQEIKPDTVYVSPAKRAKQTMLYCMAEIGVPTKLKVDVRLQELDQGDNEGQLRESVLTAEVLQRRAKEGKAFKLPGAGTESIDDATKRMHDWLEAVRLQEDPHSRIFAFGHGLAIASLIGRVAGWDHDQVLAGVGCNTSFTELTYDNRWKLGTYVLATPHLTETI